MGGNTVRVKKLDTQKPETSKKYFFLLRDSDATQKLHHFTTGHISQVFKFWINRFNLLLFKKNYKHENK